MNGTDRRIMMNLADTIKGEINRMCVTSDLAELDTMYQHATVNLKKLLDMRYHDLKVQDAVHTWKKIEVEK